jgi:hypothetical protein
LWSALLVGAALTANGCTPGSLGYLLTLGQDMKIPPQFALAESGKEVKVVIVADAGMNFSPELSDIDKLLATRFIEVLGERCKANKENVKIVPAYKVDAYRQRQLDWRSVSAQAIGKYFGADYVINLDISKISLFEEKTRQLYRGRAEIAVKVIKVNEPDGEGLKYQSDYVCPEYPRTYPVDATLSIGIFRSQFLAYVAEELSRYFTAYPSEKKYEMR